MNPVVTAAAIAPAAQFGGQNTLLAPGQTIEATVLSLLEDGAVRIALADRVLDVRSEIPLVPGAVLRFAVKPGPEGLRLVAIPGSVRLPQGATGAAPTPERSAVTDGSIAAPTVRGETRPAALPSTTIAPTVPSPAAPVRPADALAGAVRVAAARQGGLAPLFAMLEHVASFGNASPPVNDHASAARGVTPGVTIPDAVQTVVRHLLAQRFDLGEPLTADRLRHALRGSGLFLEQNLATGRNHGPDLKLLLVTLRQALRSWLEAMPPEGTLSRTSSASQPGQHSVAQALPQSAPAPPPPPYRGMPTVAQPVASPAISEAMTPAEVGQRLLEQTEAALSRQTLLQSASVPDSQERARPESAGARWLFELPLVSPAGTSVGQFEITRDGRGGDAEEPVTPVWRARFSIDVEPLGPVHALIVLADSRATVSLWAERPGVADTLRAQAGELSDRLAAAELDPGDILVRSGEPRAPRTDRPPPGRFLDQAS